MEDHAGKSEGQHKEETQQEELNRLFQSLLSVSSDITNENVQSSEILDEAVSVERLTERAKVLLATTRNYGVEPPTHLDHLNALAEALQVYLSKQLDTADFQALSQKVNVATIHWIHKFLRLPRQTLGYYRATRQRARLLLVKMALVRRYPQYKQEGFHSFGSTTPLILTSRESPWLEELRVDLGLPRRSISVFRDEKHLVGILEECLSAQSQVQPIMLFGTTGGWKEDFVGDDVVSLVNIAEKFRVWCHIEGNGIFRLAAPQGLVEDSKEISEAIAKADSILFNALSLLGFPDDNKFLSTVFYRKDKWSPQDEVKIVEKAVNGKVMGSQPSPHPVAHPETPPAKSSLSPQASSSSMVKPVDHGVLTLQLWFSLQYLGKEAITRRISKAIQLCKSLYSNLKKLPSISIISPPHSLLVVFQYIPLNQKESFEDHFIDKVNQQVFQDVINTTSATDLDLELVSKNGTAIKNHFLFNPFFSPILDSMENELIDTFTSNIHLETELIDSTLYHRSFFQQLIWRQADKGLFFVEVPDFVGLGAVRYIPPMLLTGYHLTSDPSGAPAVPTGLGSKLQSQVDQLNEQLAQKLRKEKSIFQKGVDIEKRPCIILGVDTSTTVSPKNEPGEAGEAKTVSAEVSVEKLVEPLKISGLEEAQQNIHPLKENCATYINIILELAGKVEQEFDFHQQIGKIVEVGIKEAEERMKREQERLQAQQGLIRKIPLVGNVWNWFLPVESESKGNTFSLLSTEVSEPKNIKKKPSDTEIQHPLPQQQNLETHSPPLPSNEEHHPNPPQQTAEELLPAAEPQTSNEQPKQTTQ